jgi:translation initiation factor IF-2
MAVKPQIKANQLAKDLNIKSKEMVDLMAQKGIELKAQKALEPHEFNVLFDALTSAHQIDGIDDYIDGITFIPSKLEKVEKKPEEPKAEESKTAQVVPAPANTDDSKKAEVAAPEKKETAEKVVPEQKKENVAAKTEAPAKKVQPKVDRAEAIARAAAIEKAAQEKARQREGADARQRFDAPRKPDFKSTERTAQKSGDFGNQSGFGGAQRPQAQSADRFSRMGTPNFDRQSAPVKKDARKPQQKPQQQYGNRGGMGMDKEDFVQYAPREKFQAQPIVRAQTPKGGDGNNNKKGAAKTVDIRTSSVDLSKYDEKLDSFVAENERDLRSGNNQKLKKQQNQTRQESSFNKNKNNKKGAKGAAPAPVVKKGPLKVQIPDEIVVSELASRLKVTVGEVIKKLMLMGAMATANQTIDFDTAALVAVDLGAEPEKEVVVTIEEKLFDDSEDSAEQLVTRAPVVCVMGHVDHGKTSLLDAIRHTNVTTGEAGGITQHIGAYRVRINDQDITFLDTPGHEAFTAMRARGAQATDIAILVVAADDGIMPQTVEAINHAKAAGIEIIVAINKMDKPTANPDAIKQELTKYDLVPEEWGGDIMCVPVSAHTKMGIEELLEDVLLVAEVKELKANPNRRAKGIVIEAKLDKGRGPVATVLVQNGTLHNGDIVIAGTSVGRVRAMTDHNGKQQKIAGPSVPVEIIGLAEVPTAGDEFAAVEDERMARTLADQRKAKAKEEGFRANARANLNDLFAQISEGVKDLNIIVKADVVGSAEAVKASLVKLTNDEVRVNVIHSAVGGITEGDVMFAAASNAIIVGFNVRPDKTAIDSAERQGVDMRTYRIIYQCIEEIEAAMKGMLAPKFRENLLGHAEVRQTIHVPGVGTIAGSYILDGKIARHAQIRVVRDGIVIFEDKISSLKRFKDDAKEVAQGYECGVGLEKFNDIKEGDILEAFVMEEIER